MINCLIFFSFFTVKTVMNGSYTPEFNLLYLHTLLSIRCNEKYKGKLLPGKFIEILEKIKNNSTNEEILNMTIDKYSIKTKATVKKLYHFAVELYGQRVFLHRVFPFCQNPDVCIADDQNNIENIKNSPLGPNTVNGCTVIHIRQGVHYGDWGCTRYKHQFLVKEHLMTEMGYKVRNIFWADVAVAVSSKFLREYE